MTRQDMSRIFQADAAFQQRLAQVAQRAEHHHHEDQEQPLHHTHILKIPGNEQGGSQGDDRPADEALPGFLRRDTRHQPALAEKHAGEISPRIIHPDQHENTQQHSRRIVDRITGLQEEVKDILPAVKTEHRLHLLVGVEHQEREQRKRQGHIDQPQKGIGDIVKRTVVLGIDLMDKHKRKKDQYQHQVFPGQGMDRDGKGEDVKNDPHGDAEHHLCPHLDTVQHVVKLPQGGSHDDQEDQEEREAVDQQTGQDHAHDECPRKGSFNNTAQCSRLFISCLARITSSCFTYNSASPNAR